VLGVNEECCRVRQRLNLMTAAMKRQGDGMASHLSIACAKFPGPGTDNYGVCE